MIGFPDIYASADWAVVDGAMFMGWGTSGPGIYTAISAAICVYVLWAGNRAEQKSYAAAEK